MTDNAGFDGFNPQTLFGRRLEPVNCTSSESLSASLITAVSCPGRLIRLIANLPNPPLAISLPRCGVQINTTRLMRGFARKFLAQTECGIQNRITGRISEHPELIMLTDLGISLESIDRFYPGERG